MSFLLLQRALTRLPPTQVPLLLSPALLRCLVNALEGADRLLKPAANATIQALACAAESSPAMRPALVSGLLGRGRNSDAAYDRHSSTKALRQLLSTAPSLADTGSDSDAESHRYLFRFFATAHAADSSAAGSMRRAIANGENEADALARQLDMSRVWALDQLLVLARSTLQRGKGAAAAPFGGKKQPRAAAGEADADAMEVDAAGSAAGAGGAMLPLRTLRFLFAHSFWELPPADSAGAKGELVTEVFGGRPSPPLTPAVRRVCADRFLTVLGESCTAAASVAAAAAGSGGGCALFLGALWVGPRVGAAGGRGACTRVGAWRGRRGGADPASCGRRHGRWRRQRRR